MKLRENIRRTQLFVSISELRMLIELVHAHRATQYSHETGTGVICGAKPGFVFVEDLENYLRSKEAKELKP
jgi:hypothetical protein